MKAILYDEGTNIIKRVFTNATIDGLSIVGDEGSVSDWSNGFKAQYIDDSYDFEITEHYVDGEDCVDWYEIGVTFDQIPEDKLI